jgi:hypothetical protein
MEVMILTSAWVGIYIEGAVDNVRIFSMDGVHENKDMIIQIQER